jgi:hypothetical protein
MPKRIRQCNPLLLRWQQALPTRVIRSTRRPRSMAWFEGHLSNTGQGVGEPFDFCAGIQRLVTDIARRCADFRHLVVPRILVSVTQARAGSKHGLQARVTPLRFANGTLTKQRRGVPFHIQRYFLDEQEFLYLLTFVLPRFLEQNFDQKMVTLFHELYHMSQAFDGDLRRHEGRYQFHTHCQREYDGRMVHYAREYLASRPDPSLHDFLRLDFAQLQERHGTVTGIVVPRPKIIPLVGPYAAVANIT